MVIQQNMARIASLYHASAIFPRANHSDFFNTHRRYRKRALFVRPRLGVLSVIEILQQQHGLNGCIKQVQLKSRQLPLLKAAGETARRKEETDFY